MQEILNERAVEITKEILLNIARIQKKVFILACAFNDEH
jgi:hypothetical protein